MIINIPMRPFPAVRSNSNTWTPSVIEYHNKMNKLRSYIRKDREEIIKSLISWEYMMQFFFAMPKSWSKKKRQEMGWKPMQSRPDTDNLFKAFTDTIFYKYEKHNDCEIWNACYSKVWAEEDKIIFIWDN